MASQGFINGNFDVWDYLTTVTNPASNSFTANRMRLAFAVDGGTNPSIVHSRQTLTAGDVFGSFYYYRMETDGAGSSYGNGSYYLLDISRIENGTRYLCGDSRKVTVSFYARSSVGNKKIGIGLIQTYGTGGSPSVAEVIQGKAITLTSSWVKYTHTFTTNTLSGKTFGTNNDDYLGFRLFTQWGSSIGPPYGLGAAHDWVGAGTTDVAQFKINAGAVALPFMPKSSKEEKMDCLRYCYAIKGSALTAFGSGWANQTTTATINIPLKVTMRAVPTLIATATDYVLLDTINAGVDVIGLAIDANSTNSQSIANYVILTATVASGLTQYRPYHLAADNGGTRLLILQSEL
jgi:hypothetical protein